MSVQRWSDSLEPLFQKELEEQGAAENITWEMILMPQMGQGPQGMIFGPPRAVVYITSPNVILGGPPIVITAMFDMFNMTETNVKEAVTQLVSAVGEARSQSLAEGQAAAGEIKKFELNGRN